MKRYLVIIYILSLVTLSNVSFAKDSNRNSHYFKIIAKGEITVDFSEGSLGAGGNIGLGDFTEIANTDNTKKILIVNKNTSVGLEYPFPLVDITNNFIIDYIYAFYNASTDTIVIRRRILNVDSVNSHSYPAATFAAQWHLLKEARIKSRK
mgnify:CR=1 FL=1